MKKTLLIVLLSAGMISNAQRKSKDTPIEEVNFQENLFFFILIKVIM